MSDTGPARLPGLPKVSTGNASLDAWIAAVSERLEVREGQRGNKSEQVITRRDLKNLGFDEMTAGTADGAAVLIRSPGGTYRQTSIQEFAAELMKTPMYIYLKKKIDDPTRFADLPDTIQNVLLQDLRALAAQSTANVERIDKTFQTATANMAYTVNRVTASFGGTVAGIQETLYATASDTQAAAGKVVTITGRLDNMGGTGFTLEEVMNGSATTEGVTGNYAIKIDANGYAAGFGLTVNNPTSGSASSAFIINADKFAIVTSSYTGVTDPLHPPSAVIPFGVDSSGVYINGTVRINAGGTALSSIGTGVVGFVYKQAASAPSAPTAGTGTYNFTTNTLTPPTGWTATPPTSSTTPTWVSVYTFVGTGTVTAGTWSTPAKFVQDGATGSAGSTGAAGARGATTAYATGSSWSDSVATTAICTQVGVAVSTANLVIGDTCTESNGTNFAGTKYWSGTAWVSPGVIIDGNLLVSGTVSTSALVAGTMTGFTIQTASSNPKVIMNSSNLRAIDGSGNTAFNVTPGGTATLEISQYTSTYGIISTNYNTGTVYGIYGSYQGGSSTGIGIKGQANNPGIAGVFDNSAGPFLSLATPTYSIDITTGVMRTATQIQSTVSTGTAPLSITSKTSVSNLNVQYWGSTGLPGTFASAGGTATTMPNRPTAATTGIVWATITDTSGTTIGWLPVMT